VIRTSQEGDNTSSDGVWREKMEIEKVACVGAGRVDLSWAALYASQALEVVL